MDRDREPARHDHYWDNRDSNRGRLILSPRDTFTPPTPPALPAPLAGHDKRIARDTVARMNYRYIPTLVPAVTVGVLLAIYGNDAAAAITASGVLLLGVAAMRVLGNDQQSTS